VEPLQRMNGRLDFLSNNKKIVKITVHSIHHSPSTLGEIFGNNNFIAAVINLGKKGLNVNCISLKITSLGRR